MYAFYLGRFVLIHMLCLTAYWTGISARDLIICAVLYFVRMFFVTAGYHRYFSHRTFKMSRAMQFIFAFMAQTSAQTSVLWWASHHRHHHKFSDQPEDIHSVRQDGFFHSHVGWLFDERNHETDLSRVKDLTKFPELMWLHRFPLLPATIMGAVTLGLFGWSGLIVGFMWSTVLCWHGTFTINSLSHVFGSRRYETTDDSKNNWFLALITLGEGWHNNHHYHQASVNQGFMWYEIDITYSILRVMSWLGLVSDLRMAPAHIIEQKPHPRVQLAQLKNEWGGVLEQVSAALDGLTSISETARSSAHTTLVTRAQTLYDELSGELGRMTEETQRKINVWQDQLARLHARADELAKELAGAYPEIDGVAAV